MPQYRNRRCRRCGEIFPGGRLMPVKLGTGHWHKWGGSIRQCPNCGYQAITQEFEIVRQPGDKLHQG